MYKLSSFVPPPALLNVYHALIQSNLIYGITSWGGSAQIHLNRAEVLQRRAVRLCSPDNSSNMNVLGLLSLNKLYIYFCLIKLFKNVNLGRHEYFNVEFDSLLPVHSYGTRQVSSGNFNTPSFRNTRSQNSFFFNVVVFWNNLSLIHI